MSQGVPIFKNFIKNYVKISSTAEMTFRGKFDTVKNIARL